MKIRCFQIRRRQQLPIVGLGVQKVLPRCSNSARATRCCACRSRCSRSVIAVGIATGIADQFIRRMFKVVPDGVTASDPCAFPHLASIRPSSFRCTLAQAPDRLRPLSRAYGLMRIPSRTRLLLRFRSCHIFPLDGRLTFRLPRSAPVRFEDPRQLTQLQHTFWRKQIGWVFPSLLAYCGLGGGLYRVVRACVVTGASGYMDVIMHVGG